MKKIIVFDLPIIPTTELRTDTGSIVPIEQGLVFWWDIDIFLDSRQSWVPEGPMPMARRFKHPGPSGYCG